MGRAPQVGRVLALLALTLFTGWGASGCATNPVTGRRALNAFSHEQDIELGLQAYQEYLAGAPAVTSGPDADMVQRVMQRIAVAADSFRGSNAVPFPWEVTLVRADDQVNAFALPGGKMVVYTGLIPVAQTETGLAVVMGHEVGHALARHGTERMTTHLGVETAKQLLLGEDSEIGSMVTNLALTLPHSRNQESDADHTGLILMARAGYDPREATAFWSRMMASGGSSQPEMLSTHPAGETRIKNLQDLMPEALQEWQASGAAPSP